MNELFEKTRDHVLYVCEHLECPVSTFIMQHTCPVCENPGIVARQPYDGRGTPGWSKRVAEDD